MMLTFMICHMVGVSSAITNPILYGFLNDNFLKEFKTLFQFLSKLNKSEYQNNVENENLPLGESSPQIHVTPVRRTQQEEPLSLLNKNAESTKTSVHTNQQTSDVCDIEPSSMTSSPKTTEMYVKGNR